VDQFSSIISVLVRSPTGSLSVDHLDHVLFVKNSTGRSGKADSHHRSQALHKYKRHTVNNDAVPSLSLRLAQEPPITLRVRRPEGSEGAAPLGYVRWWGDGGSHAAPVVSSRPGAERGARLAYTSECRRSGRRAVFPNVMAPKDGNDEERLQSAGW
jgi:hypothetical protein